MCSITAEQEQIRADSLLEGRAHFFYCENMFFLSESLMNPDRERLQTQQKHYNNPARMLRGFLCLRSSG